MQFYVKLIIWTIIIFADVIFSRMIHSLGKAYFVHIQSIILIAFWLTGYGFIYPELRIVSGALMIYSTVYLLRYTHEKKIAEYRFKNTIILSSGKFVKSVAIGCLESIFLFMVLDGYYWCCYGDIQIAPFFSNHVNLATEHYCKSTQVVLSQSPLWCIYITATLWFARRIILHPIRLNDTFWVGILTNIWLACFLLSGYIPYEKHKIVMIGIYGFVGLVICDTCQYLIGKLKKTYTGPSR